VARTRTIGLFGILVAMTSSAAAQERSAAESKIACDGGNAAACEEIARAYRDGEGVAPDGAKAASYFLRACDAGRADACAEQAGVMRRSRESKVVAAADLPELRACLLGRRLSCRALPRAGGDLSADRVAARLRRACDGNDAAACVMLGHFQRRGIGVARDHRRAAALYRRACDLNQGWGCLALGRAYEEGRGVKADKVRAEALFRQACAVTPLLCPRRRR